MSKQIETFALRQFEITPEALANFSPGLERSDNPGNNIQNRERNPEKGSAIGEPFQGSVAI